MLNGTILPSPERVVGCSSDSVRGVSRSGGRDEMGLSVGVFVHHEHVFRSEPDDTKGCKESFHAIRGRLEKSRDN